jgi:hypothetical protein
MPQRQAIGDIVAATYELLLSESTMRDGAEELMSHPDRITDAELDTIGNVFARGLYGMDRAFSVGKITVVDSACREAMGDAYNEFVLRVRSLHSRFADITPATAPQLFPTFLDEFRSAAKQLNIAVANLVEVGQGRISPTQSLLNWSQRRGVKNRLLQRAVALREEIGAE